MGLSREGLNAAFIQARAWKYSTLWHLNYQDGFMCHMKWVIGDTGQARPDCLMNAPATGTNLYPTCSSIFNPQTANFIIKRYGPKEEGAWSKIDSDLNPW